VILIGGVSTLLFNGNPLLRFDGYYIFSDLIEVPNLFQRANKYLFYLAQRHLFGIRDTKSPSTAPGERFWFVFYGISSFVYRLLITVTIVIFVATKFFFLGVLMAIWSTAMMYLLPTAKGVWFLMSDSNLRRRRVRALSVTAGLIAAIGIVVVFLPLPYATIAEGVAWVPGDSVVHVQTEGVVSTVLARPNHAVKRGQPLVEMTDPFIASRVKILEAEVLELSLRLRAKSVEDRAEAKLVLERLKSARSELALMKQRAADLVIHSPVDGVFVLPDYQDLKGRFLKKGDTVGFVTYPADPIVRVIVDQDDIELVREKTGYVHLRLASRFNEVYQAEIKREIPSVTNRLPSMVLATVGGGDIVLDPTDPAKGEALERIFQVELVVPEMAQAPFIGERIYVRFDHGREAIATRLYRSIRQQFLKIFNV
jgi:putative peptide zinc metalloprotease protein